MDKHYRQMYLSIAIFAIGLFWLIGTNQYETAALSVIVFAASFLTVFLPGLPVAIAIGVLQGLHGRRGRLRRASRRELRKQRARRPSR